MKKPDKITIVFITIILFSSVFRFMNINLNKSYWWDETVYLGLAKNLYENNDFKVPINNERFRPVLLPLLISAGYRLYNSEITARIIVLSFSVISIIVVFYLGKAICNKFVGLVASIFLISNQLFMLHCQKIFTESLFITFSSLAVLFFYLYFEKNQKTLILASFFTGLSCLTKHFGYVLLTVFVTYIFIRKKFNLFKKKEFYLSIIIFLLTLSPFFFLSFENYGNFWGPFIENSEHVPNLNTDPFFYLLNFFSIFGLNGLFIIPSLVMGLKKPKKGFILILISILIPTIIFNTIYWYHKEERYFLPFIQFFYILSASFFAKIKNKKPLLILIGAIAVFSTISFANGYTMMVADSTAGFSLTEACEYVKTLPGEYILSQSYPYPYYISGKIPVKPPKSVDEFNDVLINYDISYILVYVPEPENPKYLSELSTEKFEKIKTFENKWEVIETEIYKLID